MALLSRSTETSMSDLIGRLRSSTRSRDEWEAADALEAKDAEIERLRAALEFYADESRYGLRYEERRDAIVLVNQGILHDRGKRARKALNGDTEDENND